MDIVKSFPLAKTRALKFATAGRAMAHAGLGFIALGAAADASRPADVNSALGRGESIEIAGRTLTLSDVRRADGPNYLADRATLSVSGGSEVRPERRFYWAADQHTREVGLGSSVTGDLYVSIGEARPRDDGSVAYEIRAAFHPLVWMLGLGASLIVLGGLCALTAQILTRRARRAVTP